MKTHTLIVRLAGFYLFAKAAFVLTDYYQQIPAALVAAMGDVPENVNAVRALEWEFRLGVAGVLIGLFMMVRAGWLAWLMTSDAREDGRAKEGRIP